MLFPNERGCWSCFMERPSSLTASHGWLEMAPAPSHQLLHIRSVHRPSMRRLQVSTIILQMDEWKLGECTLTRFQILLRSIKLFFFLLSFLGMARIILTSTFWWCVLFCLSSRRFKKSKRQSASQISPDATSDCQAPLGRYLINDLDMSHFNFPPLSPSNTIRLQDYFIFLKLFKLISISGNCLCGAAL